jgi:hypothetical protein
MENIFETISFNFCIAEIECCKTISAQRCQPISASSRKILAKVIVTVQVICS